MKRMNTEEQNEREWKEGRHAVREERLHQNVIVNLTQERQKEHVVCVKREPKERRSHERGQKAVTEPSSRLGNKKRIEAFAGTVGRLIKIEKDP